MEQFQFLLLIQTLIFYGLFFISGLILKYIPPKMNNWYGFRTRKALKNEDNWYFAQTEASTLILTFTPIVFILSSLIKYLTDFNYSALILYSIIDILLLIVTTVMIYFLTEDRLRDHLKKSDLIGN